MSQEPAVKAARAVRNGQDKQAALAAVVSEPNRPDQATMAKGETSSMMRTTMIEYSAQAT